jgi:anti-sigma B factor antagonist
MDEMNATQDRQPFARARFTQEHPGVCVVAIEGEVDVAQVPGISAVLEEALAEQPSTVVFDLASVTFMDSSGLAIMLGVLQQVDAVWLRNPSQVVARLVSTTGLMDVLPEERR